MILNSLKLSHNEIFQDGSNFGRGGRRKVLSPHFPSFKKQFPSFSEPIVFKGVEEATNCF